MKYFILIIIFSFILSSCSIKEEAEKTAITELEGIWKTSCYVDSSDNFSHIKTITVSGTVASYKDEGHSDTSCATDYELNEENFNTLSIGNAVTFVSGGTGHYFTMKVVSSKRTPQVATLVTAYNILSACGYSDWVLNTGTDTTGKTCVSTTYGAFGSTLYGLYLLDGNNLYPDKASSHYPSSVSTVNAYVKQ